MPHNEKKETKTDLRHDTMEFSASTDGDDQLDEEDDIFAEEENDISSEELDVLGNAEDVAAALRAAEKDRLSDVDNLPEESDEDDYYDNEEPVDETDETL